MTFFFIYFFVGFGLGGSEQAHRPLLRDRPRISASLHLSRVRPGGVDREHAAAVWSVSGRSGQTVYAPDLVGDAIPPRQGHHPPRH